MKNIDNTLKELGITLPPPPSKAGLYLGCKEFGDSFLFSSGHLPHIGEDSYYGKVGTNLTIQEGQKAAENCVLNLLSTVKAHLGDLKCITSIVKLTVFVAADSDFYDHPQVANGASSLLISIFGEEIGACARSAVGVSALPGNAAVEVEMLITFQ